MRALPVLLAAELRMQLRQPTTLLFMVLLVLASGPAALLAVDHYGGALGATVTDRATGEPDKTPVKVAVPDVAAHWVRPDDRLELVSHEHADASLVLEGDFATLCRGMTPGAEAAVQRLRWAVIRENRIQSAARFAAEGLPYKPIDLLTIEERDVTSVAERRTAWIGTFLPGLLAFVVVFVASVGAIDVFTGERERGTLETLLSTPVDRRVVVGAKVLFVLVETLMGAIAVPLSLVVAGACGLESAAALDARAIGALLVVGAGLALQATGAAVVLATVAPTFKAASFLTGPVMIALLLPAGLPFAPIELGVATALVPVGNLALAGRDALAGSLGVVPALLVGLATLLHGGVAGVVAVRLLEREGTLFGEDDGKALRTAGFHGRDAAAVYLVGLVSVWFFGQSAQAIDLFWGMIFTQVVLVAGLAFAATSWVGLPLVRTLSLAPPTPRDLALAVVAGLSAPGVGVLVVLLQEPFLPVPPTVSEALADMARLRGPWWMPLFAFAVLPGVCEELLFRGALVGLLRRSLPPVALVLVVALLFGAFHLSVHRLLPTAATGVLLTLAAVRSGSLWTSMLIHVTHNAILLTAVRDAPVEGGPPPLLVAGGLAVVAVGATASMRGRG